LKCKIEGRFLIAGVLLIDTVGGSQKNLKGYEDEREGDQTTVWSRLYVVCWKLGYEDGCGYQTHGFSLSNGTTTLHYLVIGVEDA